ncbi:MAG: carbohydrate ABC transporter permease [Ruminococcaceae bacterium]|nr:carbohydrate ABC transporter permease [Oscillospiraceae bacterium]
MRLHKKKKFDYIDVIANTFLVLFSICILYPMLHVVALSLSEKGPITRNEVSIFPIGLTLDSYTYFIDHPKFLSGFINGVWYTVEGVFANLFFTALVAYPMSKYKLIGRTFLMKMFVFTMYFSGGLIPIYLQLGNMGLHGSEWAWILAGLISTYNMIIVINGYRAVPDSLYEAAYLDGASEFQVFYKIAVPLTKASLASIGLFYFIAHWNSWYNAMLYLNDEHKWPLQLFMRSVLIENKETDMNPTFDQNRLTPTGVKNSLIVLSMIPVMIVYPFVQRYFVKGVMMGSVKG